LNGLFSKEDPTLLKDGQYRNVVNCEVVQEGSLASKSGRKLLGTGGSGNSVGYRIQKMVLNPIEDPANPSTNPRYLGISDTYGMNLWRTLSYQVADFTKVASGINSASGMIRKRFSLASYTAGETGNPWAFIASEKAMLKDNGNALYASLLKWGILPAFGVAMEAADGAGLLDGGDPASPGGTTAYDYRYSYQGGDTGNEGNPSQTQLVDSVVTQAGFGGDGLSYAGVPIAVHLKQVKVLVQGTNDPQIPSGVGSQSIRVYRRGGILFDTWRFVGVADNLGAGVRSAFVDNVADADLVYAEQINLYADPPVLSTVPTTPGVQGIIAATLATGGRQTIAITADNLSLVTPGSLLSCFFDAPETVVVEAVGAGGLTVTAFFQHLQPAGTTVQCNAICGQPCNLAIPYQQFILVAGDPNNPHLIYRSLGGMPESFPVVTADGTNAVAACGSPSNPILAMVEFRGQILTLNASSLFETLVLSGNLLQGTEVSRKGLIAPFAWCKTENEVWFLSTDGIYSWDGGACRKRSEAIDNIFHNQVVNNIQPMSPAGLTLGNWTYNSAIPPCMDYYRGQIRLLYYDTGGNPAAVYCEPAFGDRWRKMDLTAGAWPNLLFTETDTGTEVQAINNLAANGTSYVLDDQQLIVGGVNYTSDLFTTDPRVQGNGINFDIRLPWMDFGNPFLEKFLSEALLDMDASGSNYIGGIAKLAVDILLDYNDQGTVYAADPAAVDTITVPLGAVSAGRSTPVSILPNQAVLGSGKVQSLGRQARAFSYHIYGTAYSTRMTFFRLLFRYDDQAELTAGGATDWMNLSTKFDKKLYWMTVEFDVAGIGQSLVIDTIAGPGAGSYNPAVQSFVLNNPTLIGGGDGSPQRALQTFPILDGTVCKEVRVRPISTAPGLNQAATVLFKILAVSFEKEEYPPDITSFTPWTDGGSEFDKYANQIELQVNTNGQFITVNIQADGQNVMVGGNPYTFTVQSTDSDRRRNVTLPPGLIGKQWRLYVNPSQANLWTGGGTGMFQLFNHRFSFQPADRGDVVHSQDWDSLGHPFDKYLSTITFEWDLSLDPPGTQVVFQMDAKTGIGGGTLTSNIAQFTLSGGRSKATFPIPANTIVKLIRVYPITTPLPIGFKNWKYEVAKTPYPADIILSTEWRDAENPDSKNPSWLYIDADTAGIAASVILQNETGTVMTVNHTGTATNRKFNYAIPADVSGKMWRLLPTPGANGKFQMWTWGFARWSPFAQGGPVDPPEIILATPWSDAGYPYGKLAKNLILTLNTGGVPCVVNLQTQEGGTVQSFTVTTTYTTRRVVLACNPNLSGTMWRLEFVPGSGGLSQLWDWSLDSIKEPAAVTQWTSYQQSFGYGFFKLLFQLWLDYTCAVPINVTFTSSTGTFTKQFPAQPTRASGPQRYYFATAWGAGLNKSVLYDVSITSSDGSTTFLLWADASGIEWLTLGQDRHAGFQKMKLSEFMQIPI
jgi:hypothetical protein